LGAPWGGNLGVAAATVAQVPSATWTVSDGTIGYIEGDEGWGVRLLGPMTDALGRSG
jgi:hypothetical protein